MWSRFAVPLSTAPGVNALMTSAKIYGMGRAQEKDFDRSRNAAGQDRVGSGIEPKASTDPAVLDGYSERRARYV